MKMPYKILMLLLPGAAVHKILEKKYSLNVDVPAASTVGRLAVGVLPYAFSAILQQKVATDRRPCKYFLPYGKMCRFVRQNYNEQVGNPEKDKGVNGFFRSVLPYGLVLWWDKEFVDEAISQVAKDQANRVQASANHFAQIKQELEHNRREEVFFHNIQEIQLLRVRLGDRRPSMSVIVTGYFTEESCVNALKSITGGGIADLEILLVPVNADSGLVASLHELAMKDSRVRVVDGLSGTCASLRMGALKAAHGDYVAFLDVNDRYISRYALELLLLHAAAEDANVCGGIQAFRERGRLNYVSGIEWDVVGKISSETTPIDSGLAAFVFNRQWLTQLEMPFFSTTVSDDALFLQAVQVCAGKIMVLGRSVSLRGNDSISAIHTTQEKQLDFVNGLGALAEYAQKRGSEKLAGCVSAILEKNAESIRSAAWRRGSAGAKATLARIDKLMPACNVESKFLRPLVSVIVPAYNVEKYLARCLDSLVSQDLISIEIIVVDDGSTDSTAEIAEQFAAKFANVTVVRKENGGLSSARNAGMAKARGTYVGFVDGDDWVESAMFDKLSSALEQEPAAEFAQCEAEVDFEYEVPEEEKKGCNEYFSVSFTGVEDLTTDIVAQLNASVCTKLYRLSFVQENGLRFPVGFENEDEVFFFMVASRAKKVCSISGRYYHYIRNSNGIMAKQLSDMSEKQKLPDGLVKSMPLIFEILKEDNRRDLWGIVYARLCGIASRFPGDEAYRVISKLLHDYDFFYYEDFLEHKQRAWVLNRLRQLANYESSDVVIPDVDRAKFPSPLVVEDVDCGERPLVTFVVPVCNCERYVARCLESLRSQTEKNIEIVCVDDGSEDDSPRILADYAKMDKRIRVVRQDRSGVSKARNLGIKEARGIYVAFADADDWLSPETAATTLKSCLSLDLDACWYDYRCFHYETHLPVGHYWTIANHASIPRRKVFAVEDLSDMPFFTGVWQIMIKREFILSNGLEFPEIPIGEDSVFIYRLLAKVRRAYVLPEVFYHYRRGNPSSAVSRLSSVGAGGKTVMAAHRQLLGNLAHVVAEEKHELTSAAYMVWLNRILQDVLYYCEKNEVDRNYVFGELRTLFGIDELMHSSALPSSSVVRIQNLDAIEVEAPVDVAVDNEVIPATCSNRVKKVMRDIMSRRAAAKCDLYLVMGQLNSKANEPIDSWTFFKWLQAKGVPSRYVIWKKHYLYGQLKKKNELKDVIVLGGDGVSDCEFLFKCKDELCRAKAVVQENGALNAQIRAWLYNLPGCEYVFLQHGVFLTRITEQIGRFLSTFNRINVSSERERRFVLESFPADKAADDVCLLAGLPRWDNLKDESGKLATEGKVVFVMFTWRKSFDEGISKVQSSAYFLGLKSLLSKKNVDRLAAKGVKLVLGVHHHLANIIAQLDMELPVQVVGTDEISYWIRHASACVTDFSSVSVDFMFQDKPVVFWIPDVHDELLDATVSDDGGKVVNAAAEIKKLYNLVDSPNAVVSLIEHYADARFVLEKGKKQINKKFFAHRSNVCEHLYKAIEGVQNKEAPR